MSRYRFAALGALASACGLAVLAGGAAGTAPALAAASSPSARAPRAAALAGSAGKTPQPVTAANTSQTINCPNNPPSIFHNTTTVTSTPWAQNALDFSQAWALSTGQNETVAVIDSGVDYTPQLAGRVSAIDETGTGITDCVGHGTAVAGIIAASSEPNTTAFVGVAPNANILSVKVTDTDQPNNTNPQLQGNSHTLSEGIIDAVNDGASVLSISIVTSYSAELQAAVQFAEGHNVVVVAAGGNDYVGGGKGPFYPASFPGVISVGAVDNTGLLANFTDPYTPESVTAPGVGVTSTDPGGYNTQLQGTSFATPFVSGVAALIRSEYPSMSAAQVTARIEATADGPTAAITGNGMVNPLQAVQADFPFGAPNASSETGHLPPVSVSRPVPPDAGTTDAAMATTAAAISLAAILAIGAAVISQGRRRRRQAQAPQAPAAPVPADAGLSDSPLW